MAEALAAVGLASALLQFIDFGGKVLRQLRRLEADAAGMPAVFTNVRSRLPLVVDLVKKIMLRMEAGLINQNSQEMMLPVLRNCAAQAEQLDGLIAKTLPEKKESSWARGRKAVLGVLVESEVERIDAALKVNFDLLAQVGTYSLIDEGKTESKSRQGSENGFFNFNGSNVHVIMQGNVDQGIPPDMSADALLPVYRSPSLPNLQPTSSIPEKPQVFMVPFDRDSNFLGRRSTIDFIDQRFEKESIVALAGLGGIGKSQIAIEYGYLYHERHPDSPVFWVYGSDPVRFEVSYQNIAKRMAFPGWDDPDVSSLQLVHETLSDETAEKWLMILDNADDESMYYGLRASERSHSEHSDDAGTRAKSYARYIPKGRKGSVLITTRDRRVGERLSGRHRPIDVSAMTPVESMELLRSKIVPEDWCEDDAMRLVAELSHLPLAITQAAAFISENCMTIAEYLETLFAGDEDAKELLSEHLEDPRRELDTENSVMRTWKLSFDQISRNMPRAAKLLSLAAVLDYHSVPVSLLRKDKETETGFRTALGALQAFSMLTATRGKDAVCKMHRLVSLALQRWLDVQGTLSCWQSEALNVLVNAFPGPGQQRYEDWSVYETLLPHTSMILGYTFDVKEELLASARLMVAIALYSMSRGRYRKAHELCLQALEIRQQVLPPEDPITLDSVQTLGEALLHVGDLAQAETMLRRAVTGREAVLGAEHPDTLESLSDLTITLLELDDLAAAKITALRALAGRKKVLGHDDADTLVSLNIYCILLHRNGDLKEAEEQYKVTLEGRRKLLGQEHPDTIITRSNFARLLYDRGQIEDARDSIEETLASEAKVLGAEGYDAQVTMSNRALALAAQGNLSDATEMLRKVLGIREKVLGEKHPSTIFSLQMLADLHDRSPEKADQEAARRLKQTIEHRGQKLKSGTSSKASALLRAGLLFD